MRDIVLPWLRGVVYRQWPCAVAVVLWALACEVYRAGRLWPHLTAVAMIIVGGEFWHLNRKREEVHRAEIEQRRVREFQDRWDRMYAPTRQRSTDGRS